MLKSLQSVRKMLAPGRKRFDFKDKVALITGAADGIGFQVATQLHRQGAKVVVVDRDEQAARRAAARLGAQSLVICADVTNRAAMREAVEHARGHFGRLDIVVANAGITPPPATLRTGNPDDFDRVIAVNVTGVLNTVQPAIEPLIKHRGHVVVVASAAAFFPPVGAVAYMVSKAAVEQLGRGLKLELAPHGVSVTVSYFGVVDTRMTRSALDEDPLGGTMEEQLPAPFRRRISAEQAGESIVSAIRARAETSMAPAIWNSYSRFRGIVNPLLDHYLMADAEVADMVRKLDSRGVEAAETAVAASPVANQHVRSSQ